MSELAELEEEVRAQLLKWENEKAAIDDIRSIKHQIEEARRELNKIYGWFTEGFDTPDLKLAEALLKELS